ncbi:MAG TPA: hypothetical protein PK095_08780, partial [Myxococcota bacterium]|nr:hypothetical protein [Myxococcota bacterium]
GALGAMMHAHSHSHGGHSLDSCAFGHAGTNSWAKPSGFPGTLGLTTVRNAFSGPQLDFDVKSRPVAAPPATGGGAAPATPAAPPANEFVVKVKPTTSTDAVHPCVSSPAGDHSTGTMSLNIGGAATNFDVFLKITPAFAQKIWNAEDEHLADALRAYNISLKEAETKVNAIASSNREFTGATEDAAKNAAKDALRATMPAKLGIDPANWRSAVWQLCLLTISQRDNLGYHTFGIAFDSVDIATHKVFNKLTDNTTQIGVHSSTSVVDLARLP